MKITVAERNELERRYDALVEDEGFFSAGHSWDLESELRGMRCDCTVTEKYSTIVNNNGTIERTTTLQFHDRQDMINHYDYEMRLKRDIEVDYTVWGHIDRMSIEIKQYVDFSDHVDAIKAYYNEDEEEDGIWVDSTDGPVFVQNEEEFLDSVEAMESHYESEE